MPSAKFEIKRKCQYCGNIFIAKTLDSKYCSRRCSQRAYDQREAAKKRMSQLNDIVENIPEARDYISVHEAVAMFGISRDTIYRLIRKGNVPAINIGQRLTRISKSKLSEMFPLRTEPIDRSRALPKSYHLEPEDCYTIGEIWHSGYFPWIHGQFICQGEGKWSCPGLRSYRSYGSEAVGWPYEQARRPPLRFRPTPLVASLPMTKIAIA